MSNIAIKVENLSKIYRLGEIGTGSIGQDVDRWFKTKILGKEDPFLKIGESNDRSTKGMSDFVYSLQDINFEINQGDAVGIIGRNGAGKSTLLKILSRVTTPTTGKINIKGRVASLLEVGTGFHPELTGRENIYLNGAILGMRKREIDRKLDEIIDFSGVERYIDTPVKRYSSGMYVRLAFAVAAHLESEILIVDEVLAVGDAEFQKKCLGKMGEVSRGEGRTVLFVSHNMAAVQQLCPSSLILKNGCVDFLGSTENAIERYGQINLVHEKIKKQQIQNLHRSSNSNLTNNILFKSIELLNQDPNSLIASNESIELILEIESLIQTNNFRFAVGIKDNFDNAVGVFFGEQVNSISQYKTKKYLMKIDNHQLARGTYYLNFSVGIGDHVRGITDFDIVEKVISFEVAYSDLKTKELISEWSKYWGNINFRNVKIEEIN
jgi:lipopolysaccharide transport system ATP-binding protein